MKTLYKLSAVLFILLLVSAAPVNAQAVADPLSIDVLAVPSITVDGVLESSWFLPMNYIAFQKDGVPAGYANTPTAGAVVKGNYRDLSTTNVRFLHKGTDLYISLQSNDQQVCKFDWEGDGMFMMIKNGSATTELKLYIVNDGPGYKIGVETGGGAAAPAGSYEGAGVVTGTIFDSSDVDGGYTAEAVLHLSQITGLTPPLQVAIVIFDPDHYSVPGSPWGTNGNYYKQWWGSEWGGTWRTLNFVETNVPVELTSFTAKLVSGKVNLEWKTATETNNKGFEVERSLDKISFNSIAFVDGKGTTTSANSYAYQDKNIAEGKTYYYRLKQIDYDGTYEYSNVIEAKNDVPEVFSLKQNYPNPFNPSTSIKFGLPVDSRVTLQVYNMIGQVVATLADGNYSAGTHNVNFDASGLTSGMYIYNIKALGIDGKVMNATKKMLMMK